MYTLTGQILTKYRYYTYVLINPIINKPFYVGKGTEQRYLDHFKEAMLNRSKNKYKTNTIKKILRENKNVIIDIVYTSDNENECFEQEKKLITKYGRKDNKTGILTNLTDGGEGGSILHTEEHKQKLRENNPGGKATSKSVYQIDPITGKIIGQWPSTRQAGLGLGIRVWRNISHSANKHKGRIVGGFYWRWIDDPDILNGVLVNVSSLNLKRTDTGLRSGKAVQQFTLSGTFVASYKNMCEAARQLNVDNSSISVAIKKSRPYAGFLWKLV